MPSPTRLYSTTVKKIINPGNIASHHAFVEPLASESTEPHVTVVAFTPKPRKLNPASVNMAPAIANEAEIRTGAIAFGSTCRKIILRFESPSDVAAET